MQLRGMQERGVLASAGPEPAAARVHVSGVPGGLVLHMTACQFRTYGQ